MNKIFSFMVDAEAEEFCLEIVSEMINKFGVDRDEAIGRINRHWRGMDFVRVDDIRYHEMPDFWASDIYYGPDSYWWMNPPNLKPLPYP